MTKKLYLPVMLLLVLSLWLGACQPTVAPTAAPAQVATEAPKVEPTKVPTKAPEPTAVPDPAPDPEALFKGLVDSLPADKGFGAVAAAKLNEEMADKAPFLLDVREAAEIEKDGFIEGAVHIPIRDLLKNLDKLPAQDQPIVVYCASGHRGGMALVALKMLGYTNVRNLGGGLGAWKKAELPVVTGSMPAEAKVLGTPTIKDQATLKMLDEFLSSMPDGFYTTKPDKLNEALASNTPPMLIDVRTQAEWDKDGYIEGAAHWPFSEFFTHVKELPAKDAPIVIYCASGHRGGMIMMALREMGYTNVTNLGGGLGAWKAAKMPVAGYTDWATVWPEFTASMPDNGMYAIKADALNTMLADEPPFLLDVREAAEIEKDGYIAGAVHIPVREVLKNLDKLPDLKEKIVVYCASGHRGGIVMAALRALGYTDVVNLNGGTGAWKKANFPLETGLPAEAKAGKAPEVDAARLAALDAFLSGLPEGFYTVKPADLNTELASSTPPVVVDVRTPEETAKGLIEGSVLLPIEKVLTSLDQLPAKDQPIVITCQSGHRGSIALMALRMLGYTNVRNLGGGINAWTAAELPLVTP